MHNQSGLIRIKRRTILYGVVVILMLGIVTPALAAYRGPDRVITDTTSVCKVILYECRYVPTKDEWRYKRVDNWSCASESDPWEDHSSSGSSQGCSAATDGDQYWEKEQTTQEVTTTYPAATITGSLQNCTLQNGWCVTAPQLSLSGAEPVSGYNIIAIEGSLNGQTFACANSTCSVPLNQGNNNFTYWALSSWGDSSTMGTLNTKVDSQMPSITGTFNGTTGSNGWYISPVSFTGTASDATSGLASFTCTLDGTTPGSCSSITINSEGAHTLVLTARDNAGNNRTLTQNTSLDIQNPDLNASLSGTLGSNNWYTAAVLNASASDPTPGSGLSTFEYNLDNSTWITFPGSGGLTLPEGKHSIDVLATDNAGRTISSSKSFWLDTVPPSVTLDPNGTLGANDWYTTHLNLIASSSDDTSGIDVFEYSLGNAAWKRYTTPLTITDGSHNISFWAQDKAGLVTQVDRTYKVDTRIPQIAGGLSGIPGTNGWYISDVALSASASDPVPGSGLDALTYMLNGNTETSYTNALVLSDGEHTVRFNAQDKAGLTYSLEQTVRVDAIHPSLNIQTTLPNWIKDTVTLNGTSGDSGSGLSKVEISTNGGQTWQPLTGTASWSYIWETTDSSNGIYEVHVRTTDNAGLTSEQIFNAGVDNHGPKISVPDSWYQWDTVTLDVWDNHSGLSEVRVEISDPEGRWPTRKISLDPERFPLDFKWDRRFGDDTVAPLGTYSMKVIAFDSLGNLTRKNASINILLGILPAGPVATAQPYVRAESTPIPTYATTPVVSSMMTQAAITNAFGSTPEPYTPVISVPETTPTPRTAPTQTRVLDWLQSIFVPNANEETVTEIGSFEETRTVPQSAASGSNVLWGAPAAAMIGSVTAYALEERRKQQEERARQAAIEAQKEERHQKIQARKMEKLEIKWAQERAWEEARLEDEGRAQYFASERSWSLPVVSQTTSGAKTEVPSEPKVDLQSGLAAYYAAMQQGEQEAQTNWWEKTKSFVSEKIIKPLSSNVYQPYIKPAMEKTQDALKNGISWLNKNIYQPYIKPAVEKQKQDIANDFAWINEKVYQPHVKQALEKTKQFVISESAWINEKIYQPYIKPKVEKVNEAISNGIAWANKNVYQPYLKPAIEKTKEVYTKYVSYLDETIYKPYIQPVVLEVNKKVYQPFIEPVVSDINHYIVQPYIKPAVDEAVDWWQETWDKYGEWVHGAIDAVGFIPGLGEVADGLNGLIYLSEGRYLEATISALAMIPVVGDLGKAGKWGLNIGQEVLQGAAEKVVKETAEELMEKATKESLDSAAKMAFKETGEEATEKTIQEALEEGAEKALQESSQALAEKLPFENWVHKALNVAGCIPGLGTVTNGIESVIHLSKGRYLEASISAVSMIPVVGDLTQLGLMSFNIGKQLLNQTAQKAALEAAKEFMEKAAKEALEEGAEKVLKETGQEVIEKAAKESLESAVTKIIKEAKEEAVANSFQNDTSSVKTEVSDEVATTLVNDLPAEKSIEKTPEQVNEATAQLIDNLKVKYGDEMVGRFLPLCEKYGINPHDILTRPPSEGQSPIGWVLGIENPANPVNHPLMSLNLTQADLDNILTQSIVRPDSKIVVLGYGDGAKPYYELSDDIEGSHLSLSAEAWAPFDKARANFWADINAPFIEKAIADRKIFVFNINKSTIVDPLNAMRFSLPEMKFIEIPDNNYVRVEFGKYELFVPQELQDSYLENLPANLIGELI